MTARKKGNLSKRQEFIDTATELFARNGVGGTSLRDVIKASKGGKGVSPSVFYYYFDSKDDLINACMDSYMGSYAQEIVDALEDESLDIPRLVSEVIGAIGKVWDNMSGFFPTQGERLDWVDRFDRYFLETLAVRIMPSLVDRLEKALAAGEIPQTRLSQTVGAEGLGYLLFSGVSTLAHRLTQAQPTTGSQMEAKFDALAGQLLGLDELEPKR